MSTEILKIKGDWQEVLNDCRSTVGKKYLSKEPSEKFKKAILISEHSPIRDIFVKWRWAGLKSWIATHFSRHKWECFIRTQRSDRTGIDRDKLPQSAPVDFTGEANIQHLIDTSRKRLCFQASKETRESWEDLKKTLKAADPYISEVMVPNCIYRYGCPEMENCGFFKLFVAFSAKQEESIDMTNIQVRYDLYNKLFYGTK